MDINFSENFLSDLILNTKAIATSFIGFVMFLIAIMLAMSLLQMILGLLIGRRTRRVRNRF